MNILKYFSTNQMGHPKILLSNRSKNLNNLKYFSTNLQAENVKCCTPNVDCKECRLYSRAWSSQFIPSAQFLQSAEMFEQWLDMMEMLGRVFIYPLPDIYQTLGSDAE